MHQGSEILTAHHSTFLANPTQVATFTHCHCYSHPRLHNYQLLYQGFLFLPTVSTKMIVSTHWWNWYQLWPPFCRQIQTGLKMQVRLIYLLPYGWIAWAVRIAEQVLSKRKGRAGMRRFERDKTNYVLKINYVLYKMMSKFVGKFHAGWHMATSMCEGCMQEWKHPTKSHNLSSKSKNCFWDCDTYSSTMRASYVNSLTDD